MQTVQTTREDNVGDSDLSYAPSCCPYGSPTATLWVGALYTFVCVCVYVLVQHHIVKLHNHFIFTLRAYSASHTFLTYHISIATEANAVSVVPWCDHLWTQSLSPSLMAPILSQPESLRTFDQIMGYQSHC